jgi:protein-arginine kinase activator protein McsA
MLCDVCKCNDATVFLTQIQDGKMQKVNLCEACSKEKGVEDPKSFALADLLLGIGASKRSRKARSHRSVRRAALARLISRKLAVPDAARAMSHR